MTAPPVLQNLLPIIQLVETIRQRRLGEAEANIARLPNAGAGVPVSQSGLNPKQMKAKYGRELAPDELVSADTPEAQQSRTLVEAIRNMTPEQLDSFRASIVSRSMGVPQITTTAGLASQAQANTAEAANKATAEGTKGKALKASDQLITEALANLSTVKPETRTRMGYALAGVGSPEQSDLDAQQTSLKAITTKMALEALADPSHPLNTAMQKGLGFNAITAAPAIAMGMGQMLDTMAQIAYQKVIGNKSIELAKVQALLDRDKEFNRAEANWAESVAKNLGGKVSPTVVANWRRWNDAGRPGNAPTGVTPALDATLRVASDVSTQAYINDQASKGDQDSQIILKLSETLSRVPNKNTAEAISRMMAKYYGRVVATKNYGPRPDGPEGIKWDALAEMFAGRFDQVKAKSMWLGGGVKMQPGQAMGGGTSMSPMAAPGAPTQPSGALPPNTPAAPGASLSPQDQQALDALTKVLQQAGVSPLSPGVQQVPVPQPPKP